MKETYIEIAFQIGQSWSLLSKNIQRSIGVINNLLYLLQLHLSDDIVCNQIAESTLHSSNYVIINDYSNRIHDLSKELIMFINQFNKQHAINIDKVIKWINDEYSAINHFNSDKMSRFSNIQRLRILHNSLKLCTLIKSNQNDILGSILIIKDNIDNFVQYKLFNSFEITFNNQIHFKDILHHFTKLSTFNIYTGDPEMHVIKSYIENKEDS